MPNLEHQSDACHNTFSPSFVDVPSVLHHRDFKRAHSSSSWLTPPATSPSSPVTVHDRDALITFPLHLPDAYSYARLAPNSLALRIHALKRSLNILSHRNLAHRLNQGSIRRDITQPSPDSSTDSDGILLHLPPRSNNHSLNKSSRPHGQPRNLSFSRPSPLYLHQNRSDTLPLSEANHHARTLSTIPQAPRLRRSDSSPIAGSSGAFGSSQRSISLSGASATPAPPPSAHEFVVDAQLREFVDFLARDSNLSSHIADVALNLDDLALSSVPDPYLSGEYLALRKRLLYALASPISENYATEAMGIASASTNIWSSHSSPAIKHASPQSIFTVELNSPWRVKAANDLACLMFGVSKSTIAALTLMDVIAPQFREFVSCRLVKLMQLVSERHDRAPGSSTPNPDNHSDLVFAGEVIAILRPGDQNYAWTSMWAKRKGNLIICMFDQIPCDAFDVTVSYSRPDRPTDIAVVSTNNVAGPLFNQHCNARFTTLDDLSPTLALDIANAASTHTSTHQRDASDVFMINSTRYYTFQFNHLGDFVPCAVACDLLDSGRGKTEIKLKVHAMPHIAGVFVVDALLYRILSCNKAVSKNLFGRGSELMRLGVINTIVPRFSAILEQGLRRNPQMVLKPGLVLPEHFFRRYDAELQILKSGEGTDADAEAEAEAESLFFASKGVCGLHRDGNSVLVDVQLRVSLLSTFVVWITYSRPTSPTTVSGHTLTTLMTSTGGIPPKENESLAPPSRDRIVSVGSGPKSPSLLKPHMLPSQLDLLSNYQHETFDYANPAAIQRNSSTRKARVDTLGLPVRYLQSKTAPLTIENEDHDPQTSSITAETPLVLESQTLCLPQQHSISSASSSPPKSGPPPPSPTPTIYSEDQMVQMEDAELQARIAQLTHWPTQVGQLRRIKKFSEFEVLEEMGQGAYGKVVMAQHKDDPHYTVIIKCIDKERILVDTWVRDRQLGTIPLEIQIMAFLNGKRHPNIMSIVDYFEDAQYYYLETPIFGNPHAIDLFDYIEIKNDMLEHDCRYIFKQIASTVYHLHQNGIVHRDIKDENVIVDERGMTKLIDFGLASYVRQGPFDVFVGTIDYASPEVLGGQKYDGKPQDVWALGILLYTIMYKENPFYNVDEIMEGELRFPYPISEGAQLLMSRILVRDIKQRLTVTDIVEDKWLQFA